MCDPYMHCEDELMLTRRCNEIIDKYGFGLSLQTKSAKVLRDIDLLESINRKAKCVIHMTLTTYDEALCRILEPNVSTTRERFEALKALRDRGIPTIVWFAPLLPFVNDSEENMRGILDYCFEAGVKGILCFNIGVTLREGDREYFYAALDRHFPGLRKKYREKYGLAYEVTSDNNTRLMKIFHEECEKHGVMHSMRDIFSYASEFPKYDEDQLTLF